MTYNQKELQSNLVIHFDKEQIGVNELFWDYQPFYTINLLLDKELLPIKKMPKLVVSEHEIVKISKKRGL
jgi:hypothetical protein